METEKIKAAVQSKNFTRVIICVGVLACALLIFHAGVEFGENRARFMSENDSNDDGVFGPSPAHRGGMSGFFSDDLSSSHGVSGKIIGISASSIIVEDTDNVEKTVLVDNTTLIRKFRDAITLSELSAGDSIVVIGSPNASGQIDARLIRVVPAPASPSAVPAAANTVNTQ